MTKTRVIPLLALAALFAACSGASAVKGSSVTAMSFLLVNEVNPVGQDTTMLVIDAQVPVDGASLAADTFAVSTENSWPEGYPATNPVYRGSRKVNGAYATSDGDTFAKSDDNKGRYIVLELGHKRLGTMDTDHSATLSYDIMGGSMTNVLLVLNYAVAQNKPFNFADGSASAEGIVYSKSEELRPNEVTPGEINPLVNLYVAGRYDRDDTHYLEYQLYSPEGEAADASVPLVVWLHGMGEGRNRFGIQNQIQIRSNEEGVAWVKPEMQAAHPCYVLVPQSPSFGWSSAGVMGLSPNYGNDMVKAVIDELLAAHKDIDPSRIYILGDSMGGYGTIDMISRYPIFAAAVTCPGGLDINNGAKDSLSPEEAAAIGSIPIWSVNIKGDNLMEAATANMYEAMAAAGLNIRWTLYPNLQSLPESNYGQAHWSWIPVLQNVPHTDDEFMYDGEGYNGKYRSEDPAGQSLIDWLFSQRLR